MVEDSDDEILSKRNFEKDSGINLDDFIIKSAFEEEQSEQIEESETISKLKKIENVNSEQERIEKNVI